MMKMRSSELKLGLFILSTLLLLCPSNSSRQLSSGDIRDLRRMLLEHGQSSKELRLELQSSVPRWLSKEEMVDFQQRKSLSRSHSFASGISSDAGTQMFLTGSDYAISFQLGDPPQNFSAIADTGSDLIWVQCSPCANCTYQQDALFDPFFSGSYTQVLCSSSLCSMDPRENCSLFDGTCIYENYTYRDGSSTSGSVGTETMVLGDVAVGPIVFGCGNDQVGDFAGLDGIVGLGRGNLSLPSQLSSIFGNVFAYCLISKFDNPTNSSPIIFGNSTLSNALGLNFTPLLSNPVYPSFYYVNLTAISVGDDLLDVANFTAGTSVSSSSVFEMNSTTGEGGTIFDSGTTFTSLVQPAYDALKQILEEAIPFPVVSVSGFDCCFNLSAPPNISDPSVASVLNGSDPVAASALNVSLPVVASTQNISVPVITFHFTGANFTLPSNNTFVFMDTADEILCLGMVGAGSSSTGPGTIVGNYQQQNFLVVYDVDGSRLGWEPQQCDAF